MSELISRTIDTYPFECVYQSYRGGVRVDFAGNGQTVTIFRHSAGVLIPVATGTATCEPPLTLTAPIGAGSEYTVRVEGGMQGECGELSITDINYSLVDTNLDLSDITIDNLTAQIDLSPVVDAINAQDLTVDLSSVVDAIDGVVRVDYEVLDFCAITDAGIRIDNVRVLSERRFDASGGLVSNDHVLAQLSSDGQTWLPYTLQAGEVVGECPASDENANSIYIGDRCFEMADSEVTLSVSGGTGGGGTPVNVVNFDGNGTDLSADSYYGQTNPSADGVALTINPSNQVEGETTYLYLSFNQPYPLECVTITNTGGQDNPIESVGGDLVGVDGDFVQNGGLIELPANGTGDLLFDGSPVNGVNLYFSTDDDPGEITINGFCSFEPGGRGTAFGKCDTDGNQIWTDRVTGEVVDFDVVNEVDCNESPPTLLNTKCFELARSFLDTVNVIDVAPSQPSSATIEVTPNINTQVSSLIIQVVNNDSVDLPFSINIEGQVLPIADVIGGPPSAPGTIPPGRYQLLFELDTPIDVFDGDPIIITEASGGVANVFWTSGTDTGGNQVAFSTTGAVFPQIRILEGATDRYEEREFSNGDILRYDTLNNIIDEIPEDAEQVPCVELFRAEREEVSTEMGGSATIAPGDTFTFPANARAIAIAPNDAAASFNFVGGGFNTLGSNIPAAWGNGNSLVLSNSSDGVVTAITGNVQVTWEV